ncbi:amidohydrolase family protein [Alicyclobacillus shizuokensis]|uniref:amidohydrolase family protein n=1 Tax=Alicyclobacillus shizuokensis TaxID=392014 RepID=UPI001C3F343F|nr:amidohydrolase family protein [Alicyclobacillus shizuokensis]
MRSIPAIYDLNVRLKVIEQFDNYSQIISLGMPPLEAIGEPPLSVELARMANDGMAELVSRYPRHFAGFLAALPMNAPAAAEKEAERAFTELRANGLQIHTNVNGKPLDSEEFYPIFEVAHKYNRPILLHPARTAGMADYATETKSKYEIWWALGWPYETNAALARLVFSGILDRLPNLKVVAHHMGGLIPYLEGRVGPGWDQLGSRTSDEDLNSVLQGLRRRPFEYFKDFYADTALFGARAATVCGLEFFGANRLVFASDCPFDPEKGPGYIKSTIEILHSLDIPQDDLEKICFWNAEQLFGLVPAGR